NHVHLDVPAFIPNYQKMVKNSILYLMPENKEFSKNQRLTAGKCPLSALWAGREQFLYETDTCRKEKNVV
ncbi:MAG: hypothetical protein IIT47_06870, partial [Oscillospiraceae bacterium]|nr:hypothetical protein [Oscillospiraceae bacterium]